MAMKAKPVSASDRTLSGSYELAGKKRSYTVTIHGLYPDEADRVLSPVKKGAPGDFVIKPQGPKRLGAGKRATP